MSQDNKDKIIETLRNNFEKIAKELKTYKRIYESQKKQIKALEAIASDFQNKNRELSTQNEKLKQNLDLLKLQINHMKPLKYYKTYNNLTSYSSKNKRKRDYHKMLDFSMKNIVECKKAKVILTLDGSKNMELTWNEKEMLKHRNQLNEESNINEDSDGDESDSHYDDFNTKELFRMIVCVMDKVRFSQDAYRNLRAVTQGHLPSINRIIKERDIMSKEIPFLRHSTVHTLILWNNVFAINLN